MVCRTLPRSFWSRSCRHDVRLCRDWCKCAPKRDSMTIRKDERQIPTNYRNYIWQNINIRSLRSGHNDQFKIWSKKWPPELEWLAQCCKGWCFVPDSTSLDSLGSTPKSYYEYSIWQNNHRSPDGCLKVVLWARVHCLLCFPWEWQIPISWCWKHWRFKTPFGHPEISGILLKGIETRLPKL